MYNKVILVGNLTRDPELRYTPQGTPVCNFRLAVSTRYKQSQEAKEDTLFIDIVTFGKQAETCSQYLTKGKPALVEGKLQERKWESDGQQRSKVEVIASTVRFLGKKGDGSAPPSEEVDHGEAVSDLEPF